MSEHLDGNWRAILSLLEAPIINDGAKVEAARAALRILTADLAAKPATPKPMSKSNAYNHFDRVPLTQELAQMADQLIKAHGSNATAEALGTSRQTLHAIRQWTPKPRMAPWPTR